MADAPASTVFVTLGSNIEPRTNLVRAVARLARELDVESVSGVWESEPHGAPGTPRFLNAAVRLATRLQPLELKALLRRIEADLGRRRAGDRNAPRPIDLDIAIFGSRVIDDPEGGLRIPDPEVPLRAYLALPLAEVGADAIHPLTGKPLAEIAATVDLGAEPPRRLALDLASAVGVGGRGVVFSAGSSAEAKPGDRR